METPAYQTHSDRATAREGLKADLAAARAEARARWQRHLLPLMIFTVIVALFAFLALSLYQAWVVRESINAAPQLDLRPILDSVNCSDSSKTSVRIQCPEWKVAALLEQHTISRRYHQANIAMLVRISVKYLGFLTGMLMSIVGAVFVLGRLTEASSRLATQGPFGKFTIATVSPGLILAVLGTVLMITTVMVNPPTEVNDVSVYLPPPAVTPSTSPNSTR